MDGPPLQNELELASPMQCAGCAIDGNGEAEETSSQDVQPPETAREKRTRESDSDCTDDRQDADGNKRIVLSEQRDAAHAQDDQSGPTSANQISMMEWGRFINFVGSDHPILTMPGVRDAPLEYLARFNKGMLEVMEGKWRRPEGGDKVSEQYDKMRCSQHHWGDDWQTGVNEPTLDEERND